MDYVSWVEHVYAAVLAGAERTQALTYDHEVTLTEVADILGFTEVDRVTPHRNSQQRALSSAIEDLSDPYFLWRKKDTSKANPSFRVSRRGSMSPASAFLKYRMRVSGAHLSPLHTRLFRDLVRSSEERYENYVDLVPLEVDRWLQSVCQRFNLGTSAVPNELLAKLDRLLFVKTWRQDGKQYVRPTYRGTLKIQRPPRLGPVYSWPLKVMGIVYEPLFQVLMWLFFKGDKPVFLQRVSRNKAKTKEMIALDNKARERGQSNVFVSYSHKDKRWLEMLKTVLQPYVREEMISLWDDTQVDVGTNWREKIADALAVAGIAILLVTPNFLASEFIARNELPPLLDAAANEGLTIFWIAVSSSAYKITPLEKYQAANDPHRPLDQLPRPKQHEHLVKICETIWSQSAFAHQ